MQRRTFLKRNLLLSLGIGFGARDVHARWNAEQFANQPLADAMTRLFGLQSVVDSDRIELDLPKTAEDGAVVAMTISSELEGIDRVYVLVEKNPTPLAAEFTLSGSAMLYISARIKMAESANVVVIARQGERLLKTRQWVDVVQGGCGTG